MGKLVIMEGSMAVAEAVKACRPGVISAYPISPQTHIVENLAQMVANGELECEYVCVESEFSAASVVYGASATGVRAYTASSSQGLLLMTEVIYNAAGTRLPIVFTGVNRSVSAPISIQIDHQDTVSLRDSGLIQFYVESSQEAYDMHIQAFKLAEDPDILLPVMVCMDGWILTHTYEPITRLGQEAVDAFLPPYSPVQYLTQDNPLTYGSHAEDDVMMEFKYMIHDAQLRAKAKAEAIAGEFAELSGRDHGGLIEKYRTEDAEVILIAMGSMVGTIKDAIDEMRAEGQKVGLVKLRCFRPFPAEAILEAIREAGIVATMDMNVSMGSEGAIALDLKSALYNLPTRPLVLSLVVGIASREVTKQTVKEITARARDALDAGRVEERGEWVDLNRAII